MSEFSELFHVDFEEALNFFRLNLGEVAPAISVSNEETMYVASILAHYAQTSRYDTAFMPPFLDLSEVFDNFIFSGTGLRDSEIMELAGAQSLLLAGFFRDQMSIRHNLKWYDRIGQSFYDQACRCSKDKTRRKLFRRISVHFPIWTVSCRDLSRILRDRPYLLNLPKRPES